MGRTLEITELPAAVEAFVSGWQAGRADEVTALFADDAVVEDEGHGHHGRDAIGAWIDREIHRFTTTVSFRGAREEDGIVTAVYRTEGDFPGGVVDIEYRVRLDDDGRITALEFVPVG